MVINCKFLNTSLAYVNRSKLYRFNYNLPHQIKIGQKVIVMTQYGPQVVEYVSNADYNLTATRDVIDILDTGIYDQLKSLKDARKNAKKAIRDYLNDLDELALARLVLLNTNDQNLEDLIDNYYDLINNHYKVTGGF